MKIAPFNQKILKTVTIEIINEKAIELLKDLELLLLIRINYENTAPNAVNWGGSLQRGNVQTATR